MYFSRKFSSLELNYSVYNKELMTIVMSFRQWRHYLENVSEIKVWSDHANLKHFMSQMMLNSCQACWLIQLTSYNFTIQYHQDTLNSVNESSQKPDYMMMKQSERHHKSTEKSHELSFKQFQSMFTQNNSSSSTSVEDKSAWQIDDLISTLVNKLMIVMLRVSKQYSCHIRETDFKTKCLIQVLSLQATTQSKIRLIADNFMSYREILNSLSQKIMFSDIFINDYYYSSSSIKMYAV